MEGSWCSPSGNDGPTSQRDGCNYAVPRDTEKGWLVQTNGPQESLIQKTSIELRLERHSLVFVKEHSSQGEQPEEGHETQYAWWSDTVQSDLMMDAQTKWCVLVHVYTRMCCISMSLSTSVFVTTYRENLCGMDPDVGKHCVWASSCGAVVYPSD